MLSPLNKRRNFNKNEVNAEQNKIEFKNINIDVQTFKKILNTVTNDHEETERVNFRKVTFKGKIIEAIEEYFK